MVDTPASKAGARLGVRVRLPRLVLGGKTVEYGCVWARVVADIGACSPVVGAAAGCVFLWRLVRGFLLRVLRALCVCCFVPPVLDSNPAWLLGPTANRFAHIVWVGFDSSAVRWGPRPCLLGVPRLCSGGRGVGFSLFLVSAMFGRLSASSGWARPCWGVFVVVPFHLWLDRD